ncbi:hypothetical protein [Luteibacter sp. dw_328]|uniref:hypothetical protein n=1 Tax=Luteibacter sp. dw_328 TaxID=2719796 RepID=UPI001BD1D0D0|nr:hypothetical protein [Luteibacter sp. dw_328]
MSLSESQPDDTGSEPENAPVRKAQSALGKIDRSLSQKEWSSPGVQKMLLANLERLEAETQNFAEVRKAFHEVDKKAAVLEEKFKVHTSLEIITMSTLAGGAFFLGFAPSLWPKEPVLCFIVIGVGIVLTVAAIIAKVNRP